MTCPPNIAAILLAIVHRGVLNARLAGWSGNAAAAAAEADHIHNLPAAIADYSPERLQYYWDVERVCYTDALANAKSDQAAGFDALWEQLRPHVERFASPVTVG